MLYRIAFAMGIVVHRVYAPFIPGTVVRSMDNPVHQRVAEQHVRMRHVYLGTEHLLAVGVFPVAHFPEKPEVLFNGAVPVRAFRTRGAHRTPSGAYFFLRLVVHVCQTFLYQFFSPFVQLLEIVGRIIFACPFEAEPLYVLLDRIHVFGILFDRISVVETEIGFSTVFFCQSEIQANTFCMSYMKIPVRLRREPRHYRFIFS